VHREEVKTQIKAKIKNILIEKPKQKFQKAKNYFEKKKVEILEIKELARKSREEREYNKRKAYIEEHF